MNTASIYKIKKASYIIHGQSKTISGFRVASEPYYNISEKEATPDVLANAIKASLNNNDDKSLHNPKDWKKFEKDLLKQIGLKSMKELDSPSNKNVSVEKDGSEIIFTPSRPAEKPGKGFLYKDPSQSIKINVDASTHDIIDALEFALIKCG